MRKFESIKISYDRNEIEITSRNPDIYTMILEATQTALYFGGSVNNYQLSSESFNGCIAIELQCADSTLDMHGLEVKAVFSMG